MRKAINQKNVEAIALQDYAKEVKTLSLLMALSVGTSYLQEKAGAEFSEYLQETAGEILYDLGYEAGKPGGLQEVTRLLDNIVEDVLSDYIHIVET